MTTFTKKHYVSMAKIIKDGSIEARYISEINIPVLDVGLLVSKLCLFFAQDNQLFDSRKFKKACGISI